MTMGGLYSSKRRNHAHVPGPSVLCQLSLLRVRWTCMLVHNLQVDQTLLTLSVNQHLRVDMGLVFWAQMG